ncbi:MAG TPA: amylo-alpha-1,6-glucosidase [Ktedonobacteraceae bacterium]|nr:amylo-alpha-1,6-glucosidase [Ktedonobacteraceae bacterium]
MISTPVNAWNLALNRDICADVEAGLNHEWLVTNGLGGYAAGTINGATTRSYHGLLVAALRPPVERSVLVTKIDEEVEVASERGQSQTYKLGVNEYQDGTLDPQGYNYLEKFALDGDIPIFTYQLNEHITLEKRVWMEYGQNTTYVQYALRPILDEDASNVKITLHLLPFCLYRDHHNTTRGSLDWHFQVEIEGNSCGVRAGDDAPTCRMLAGPGASFSPHSPAGWWYWHVLHRRDRERGLPDVEDVYQPGIFHMLLAIGRPVTLVLSAEQKLAEQFGGERHEEVVAQACKRHQRRMKQLLDIADRSTTNLPRKDPVFARLVIAADQFIVARPETGHDQSRPYKLTPDRKTVIAGYPWFTDWGRDSMISLPGLLLLTGRYSEARGLLKAFVSYTHEGLIPNRFPDKGETPEYNTADATLWMFHALNQYTSTTNDWSLVKELYPTLCDIIEWHKRGTLYGIGVDPGDGLLHAGAPGVQLTWMDAKVDDWVVTPRRGKPVEVNALWYCALRCMESWAMQLAYDALEYGQLLTQVRENFARRFWYEEGGYLYDVVDVDGIAGQNDAALRPNQLFAASLTTHLLSEEQTRSMLQKVTDQLLTPMGLRTLSPRDPDYHKHFNGKREERDAAYHQGAIWPWLIGPYVDVHLRLNNDCLSLLPLLQPLVRHLWDDCVGSICEVAEPESFAPAGCFAQAWSVAELLRVWLAVAG